MRRRTLLQALACLALTPKLTWAVPGDSQAQGHSVLSLAFSPSGDLLAAGGCEKSDGGGFDGAIRIYEVASGKRLKVLQGHAQSTEGLFWISEDELVSWGSQELARDGRHPRGQRLRVWGLKEATMDKEVDQDQRYPSGIQFRIRQLDYQLYWSCHDGLMLWRGRRFERVLGVGPVVRAISADGTRVLYSEGDDFEAFEIQARKRHPLREAKIDWVAPLPGGGWLTYQSQAGYQTCAADLSPQGQPLSAPAPWAYDCSDTRLTVAHSQGLHCWSSAAAQPVERRLTVPTSDKPLVTALHPSSGRMACAIPTATGAVLRWIFWAP